LRTNDDGRQGELPGGWTGKGVDEDTSAAGRSLNVKHQGTHTIKAIRFRTPADTSTKGSLELRLVVFRKYPRVALRSLVPGEKLWCAAWLVAAVWLLVVPRLRRAISRPRDATARRPEP